MFKGELASTQLRGAPSFSYCTTTAVDLARVSAEPGADASGEGREGSRVHPTGKGRGLRECLILYRSTVVPYLCEL